MFYNEPCRVIKAQRNWISAYDDTHSLFKVKWSSGILGHQNQLIETYLFDEFEKIVQEVFKDVNGFLLVQWVLISMLAASSSSAAPSYLMIFSRVTKNNISLLLMLPP